jgi:hypothetical protein
MNFLMDPEPEHAPTPVFSIGSLFQAHGRNGMVVSGSFLLPEGRAYRVDYEDAMSGADAVTCLENEMYLR